MLFKLIKEDVEKLIGCNDAKLVTIIKSLIIYKGLNALYLYRLSNYFHSRNHKIIAIFFRNRNIKLFGCDIDQRASLGKRIIIPHPNGIVIGKKTVIGNDVVIQHQVTCGLKKLSEEENPIIGNNVFIGAGAKILGKIVIGNNVTIGADSLVINDVEDDCTVCGIPAKKVSVR